MNKAYLKHVLHKTDWSILIIVAVLLVVGFVMMISTSSVVGLQFYQDAYFFVRKMGVFFCIGVIALLFGLLFPHRFYLHFVGAGIFVSLLLLAFTFIPGIGVIKGGARRWIDLGFFNCQPIEFAKFFYALFLASALAYKGQVLKSFLKGALPLFIILFLFFIPLIFQPDLGNIVLMTLVAFAAFFVSKLPFIKLFFLGLFGFILVSLNLFLHDYQMDRVTAFLDPWADPLGKNYHQIQSFVSIGSGGFWGVGLGESKMKYFSLPLQYSDFIFAILCEEGGFVLAVIVVFLYGLLIFRCFKVFEKLDDAFSFYLGFILLMFIVLQAFMNIGVVIGLLPVTGIPLTFISFGGTSLICSMGFIGVILNISQFRTVTEVPFVSR